MSHDAHATGNQPMAAGERHVICVTCGTQYPAGTTPPPECPICEDDRQYLGPNGQQWTTLADLQATHRNVVQVVEPGLHAIASEPKIAIGQRAYLIETPAGNLLWDCISLIDEATVAAVRERGGLTGIAISHPHFFSSMVEWSRAFGGIPIYLHAAHRPFVMRPDDAIVYWEGETREILPGLTAIRCGGHFPGSTALHWANGAEGTGALLAADTIYVVSDRRWVSFMYSYPNLIPLAPPAIEGIVAAVEPFAFDRIYSSWEGAVLPTDARAAVVRSAQRYIRHLRGEAQ